MSSKDQPRCDKCKRFMAVQEADDIVVWHASCYLCVTCRLDDTCDGCVDWHQMDWVDFYDRRAALQHRKDQSAADQKAKASASGSASSKPSTVTQSGPGPLMGLVTATEMARHHRAASLSVPRHRRIPLPASLCTVHILSPLQPSLTPPSRRLQTRGPRRRGKL